MWKNSRRTVCYHFCYPIRQNRAKLDDTGWKAHSQKPALDKHYLNNATLDDMATSNLAFVDARGGCGVVSVVAPRRMMEMDDEIAIV